MRSEATDNIGKRPAMAVQNERNVKWYGNVLVRLYATYDSLLKDTGYLSDFEAGGGSLSGFSFLAWSSSVSRPLSFTAFCAPALYKPE